MGNTRYRLKDKNDMYYRECPQCGTISKDKRCPKCNTETTEHFAQRIDLS